MTAGNTPGNDRWLVLIHQLPAKPSNLRVRIWRRMRQLGAVALRNSVYVLPNSAEGREDFEWLRTEITGLGGAASVMTANVVDAFSDEELVDRFRLERATDYRKLSKDADKVLRSWRSRGRAVTRATARRHAQALRERYVRIRALDYFGSPDAGLAGDRVSQVEATLATSDAAPATPRGVIDQFRGKVWVTRSRPGIDRMASAWLIRRFVDSSARFAFLSPDEPLPAEQVPFDTYRAEFGHHGTRCTIETLILRFGITDPAAVRLAQVVHDLDLKDRRYELAEGVALGRIVDGLRDAYADDHELLAQGIVVMEALYRSFDSERGTDHGRPARTKRR